MSQEKYNRTAFHRLLDLNEPAKRKLGGQAEAAAWLQQPNAALGGEAPLSLLLTEEGASRVAAALQAA